MTEDIFVYLIDFPSPRTHEMVVPCEGGYTVYLDAKMPRNRQITALNHAIDHILNRDWEKGDVNQIEFASHNGEERPHGTVSLPRRY